MGWGFVPAGNFFDTVKRTLSLLKLYIEFLSLKVGSLIESLPLFFKAFSGVPPMHISNLVIHNIIHRDLIFGAGVLKVESITSVYNVS